MSRKICVFEVLRGGKDGIIKFTFEVTKKNKNRIITVNHV